MYYFADFVKGWIVTPIIVYPDGGVVVASSVTFTELHACWQYDECGLPAGKHWNATVDSFTHTSTAPCINITETNGAYQTSAAAPGYTSSAVCNITAVPGPYATFTVQFSRASTAQLSSPSTATMKEGIGISTVVGTIAGARANIFVVTAIRKTRKVPEWARLKKQVRLQAGV